MSEWKEIRVDNMGKVITGKTPKTFNPEFYGGNVPFLTPSDNMDVKYVYETKKTLTEEGRLSVKNVTVPKDTVCVSCIGSDLGKVVITTQDTVTNQQINSVVVDKKHYDVDFVYYALVELGKVLNHDSKTSTAVPIVNKSTFSQYQVMCPDKSDQEKVAGILNSIDGKIEENERINKNLAA